RRRPRPGRRSTRGPGRQGARAEGEGGAPRRPRRGPGRPQQGVRGRGRGAVGNKTQGAGDRGRGSVKPSEERDEALPPLGSWLAPEPCLLPPVLKRRPMATQISAEMVKELREKTGAGILECKKALSENGGDLEKSAEALMKAGLIKATKKA